jgi:hypothetical protein
MIALAFAATLTVVFPPPKPDCRLPPTANTAFVGHKPMRKLGEAPDANEILAVQRSIGGCDFQQVVRTGVSTPGVRVPQGLHVEGLVGVLVPSGNAAVEPAKPTGEPH